jgi:uncharacterized protein YdaU (DUF1376 family)
MKKEKDPAFLMYSKDFLTGTYFMSYEEKGKYIELLCLQHQTGHLTDGQISRVLSDDDIQLFEKFRQDEDGKWYNVKLDQEIERRKNYSEYQSELAKRRWSKDAKASANKDANAPAKASAKRKPNDMPNECMRTETETVTGKYLSTIEASTPNHLFKEEALPQTHNSLEDLYESL